MPVRYEAARPHMLHALQRSELFDFAVDADQFHAFLSDAVHLMQVAFMGDDAIGFASGTILLHPEKPPALFVNELSVSERWRRRGIATALIRRLHRASNCDGVWLATESDSTDALALYRHLKGRETDHISMFEWDAKTPM